MSLDTNNVFISKTIFLSQLFLDYNLDFTHLNDLPPSQPNTNIGFESAFWGKVTNYLSTICHNLRSLSLDLIIHKKWDSNR